MFWAGPIKDRAGVVRVAATAGDGTRNTAIFIEAPSLWGCAYTHRRLRDHRWRWLRTGRRALGVVHEVLRSSFVATRHSIAEPRERERKSPGFFTKHVCDEFYAALSPDAPAGRAGGGGAGDRWLPAT